MNPGVAFKRVAILVFAALLLEFCSRIGLVPQVMLPPPSDVIATLLRILTNPNSLSAIPQPSLDFYGNLGITLLEVAVSYSIVSSVGLVAGFAIGQVKLLEEAFEPLIVIAFAIPNVVLYPLILLLLGFGPMSKIAFGVITGLFPVVSSTIAGMRQVDRDFIRCARSLGASNLQLYLKVVFPASAFVVVTGLKQGFSLAVLGVIAAELISSPSGIGYLLNYEIQLFRTSEAFALVIVVLALSITGLQVLNWLEKHLGR